MKTCFVLLLTAASIATADDAKDATVRALCDRSNQVSGLKFQSPQPFVMKIKVDVLKTFANPAVEGSVAFMDTGIFWREDLRFPDYGYSSISDDKRAWVMRSTPIEPGLVTDTLRLINGSPSMRPFANAVLRDKLEQIKKTSRDHLALTCLESKSDFETCFDDQTGVTVSQSDEHARWEYKDFQEFHGKLVPRRMDYFWDKKPLITASVIGIEDVVPDPKLFAPGPNYEEEAVCKGTLTHPKLVRTVDPAFPTGYRGSLADPVMNVVKLRLADDGTVKDAIIIKTINSAFDAESLKAVRQWKFEPWSCDGVPFERDITVQVNFHLR